MTDLKIDKNSMCTKRKVCFVVTVIGDDTVTCKKLSKLAQAAGLLDYL